MQTLFPPHTAEVMADLKQTSTTTDFSQAYDAIWTPNLAVKAFLDCQLLTVIV